MNFFKTLAIVGLVGVGVVYGESVDTNSYKVVSTSADGKYQIRAYPYVPPPTPDPIGIPFSDFWIYDIQLNKKVYQIEGPFDERYGFDWITHWHPKKPWVAVDISDGRYSGHISIIAAVGAKWKSLPIPNYKDISLGMVGGLTDKYTIPHFNKWDKDNVVIDYSFNAYNFIGDVANRDSVPDYKLWKLKGSYDFQVKLWVQAERYMVSLIGLNKVKEE
jgi:hypothetical protein